MKGLGYVIEVVPAERQGRGRFWCEGRRGYTNELHWAGLYSEEEARAIEASSDRGERAVPLEQIVEQIAAERHPEPALPGPGTVGEILRKLPTKAQQELSAQITRWYLWRTQRMGKPTARPEGALQALLDANAAVAAQPIVRGIPSGFVVDESALALLWVEEERAGYHKIGNLDEKIAIATIDEGIVLILDDSNYLFDSGSARELAWMLLGAAGSRAERELTESPDPGLPSDLKEEACEP